MKTTSLLGRRVWLAGLALFAATSASAKTAEEPDAGKIRVGLIRLTVHGMVYAAEKLGYFKDEGIQVEPVIIRNGPEGQAAVVGGSLEFAGVNSVSFLFARSEDFPLIAVADAARGPDKPPAPIAILTLAGGPIDAPRNLEGKIVGTGARKTIAELHFILWADASGSAGPGWKATGNQRSRATRIRPRSATGSKSRPGRQWTALSGGESRCQGRPWWAKIVSKSWDAASEANQSFQRSVPKMAFTLSPYDAPKEEWYNHAT